ncbi:MAG TPA: trigger factor [Steroidobacteraceae bacterium]|jgi:trigger factor|nr:trigger factor [Steroidobacteraceae bacterium]
MQVSVTTTAGLERRLEVAVPGERVAGEVDQRLKHLARTARLKGFRPGKVPYAVVKQQFGSQVHAEAVSALMQSTFHEAVNQQNLRPVAGPRIEPIQVEPGSELRYAAVFEVLPEIAVKPLENLSLERPVASVQDADVDALLERMREQRPRFSEVTRPAREGDRVTIDHVGRIAGAEFAGGTGKGLAVQLGAKQILPELDQALIGMSVGESRTVKTRFPDDYGSAEVAGKEAEFDLTVTRIEERSLPALDDEFAREFGVNEGGFAKLRTEVRANMERELADAVRVRMRDQLFEALHRDNPLEVPRALVEEQVQQLGRQLMQRLGERADPKDLPPKEQFEPNARRRVALGLLLGEIIRAQELKVDRTRLEQRLDALAAQARDPQEVRRQYLGSHEAMRSLESATLEEQAVDWMLGQVKITERPSSFQEITGFGKSE